MHVFNPKIMGIRNYLNLPNTSIKARRDLMIKSLNSDEIKMKRLKLYHIDKRLSKTKKRYANKWEKARLNRLQVLHYDTTFSFWPNMQISVFASLPK